MLIVKFAEVASEGTVTEAGTLTNEALLLVRLITLDVCVAFGNVTTACAEEPGLFVIERVNAAFGCAATVTKTCLSDWPPEGVKRPEAEITLQPEELVE